MAKSEAAICNLALLAAQITKRIQDLDTDSSVEGGMCRDLFDHERDKLYEDYRLPFAEAQATLTPLGAAAYDAATSYAKKASVSLNGVVYISLIEANLGNSPDTSGTKWRKLSWGGWTYAFALPADLVAVREVYPCYRLAGADEEIPRKLVSDVDLGTLMLCDESAPDLRYTRRVEATVLFPEKFTEALSLRLGSKLAMATGKPELALSLAQLSDAKAGEAMGAQQAQEHEAHLESKFVRSRA